MNNMMKDLNVVVPTRLESEVVEIAKGKWTIEYRYGQYQFTLGEALEYLVEQRDKYLLEDIVLYNVPLRDRLREVGISAFAEELKLLRPDDAVFAEYVDYFKDCHKDIKLADFDIQLYAATEDFTIGKYTFHGLDDLKSRVCLSAPSCVDKIRFFNDMDADASHAPFVSELYERYPCFDSEDYANENRFYLNFIIRDTVVTRDDLEKLNTLRGGNSQKLTEQTPSNMLPMVYYDGESGYILVGNVKKLVNYNEKTHTKDIR